MNRTAISSDDPNAVEKLKAKLETLQSVQAHMKKVNAYYRKYHTCVGCDGVSDADAQKMDARVQSGHSWEKAPFPSYQTTGNNQEMRRIKERIASLEQARETGFCGWEFHGGTVDANTDLNRLQIFFDARPDKETCARLKARGFHWSPTNGAWQRQLNDNAIYAASCVDCLKPKDGADPMKLQPKPKKHDALER